jgi:hypothetical protein
MGYRLSFGVFCISLIGLAFFGYVFGLPGFIGFAVMMYLLR